MKFLINTTIVAIMTISSVYSAEQPDIAVFKDGVDTIEEVLDAYRLNYNLYDYREIENEEIYKLHQVIFFPCGIENPYESNIKVKMTGRGISGVELDKKYYIADKKPVSNNIRSFINAGGSAYFSGHSYIYLQDAYKPFSFYFNFPYSGLPGTYKVNLHKDLKSFSSTESLTLNLNHTGWVVIKPEKGYETLAETSAKTPRGNKKAVITAAMREKDGYMLYTSCHKSSFNTLKRFSIYRTIGAAYTSELKKTAEKWGQKITHEITDAVHSAEYSRKYDINLLKGNNTIYFASRKDYYQINILDSRHNLIYSVDSFRKYHEIDINIHKDTSAIIKVLPSTNERYGIYTIISAHGVKIFPYFFEITKWGLIAALVVIFILIFRIFFGRKYE